MRDYGDLNKNVYEYDYRIGMGWPYYKKLTYVPEQTPGALPGEREYFDIFGAELHEHLEENQLPVPLDFSDRYIDEAPDGFDDLYCHINKTLKPYINKVLAGTGGAVNLKTGRETLDKIVDQVLEIVKNNHAEFADISTDGKKEYWSIYYLLCALIEALALKELTVCANRNKPVVRDEDLDYSRYL